jgi:lipid-A-disaccharide synthase
MATGKWSLEGSDMIPRSVVMVAGEASGDQHGSHLIHELKRRCRHVRISGIGGRAMQAAGAEILYSADKLAVVGVTEVLAKAPRLLKAIAELKRRLAHSKPDLLILIDFPDFNLHLAATAKRLGIPVLYYISPQVWAWRSRRVRKIKARVNHMAVILPFEQEFYAQYGVPVSFVGHPLMDALGNLASPHPAAERSPIIGLLPGSRDSEVRRLLPPMLQSAALLQERMSTLRFVVSRAPTIDGALIQSIVKLSRMPQIEISDEPVHSIFERCRLAIAASGTVTLEAAICCTPVIITYKVSPLSYLLGKILVNVRHIGLVNLIAGRRLVPELVQHQVTAAAITRHAFDLLSNPKAFERVCTGLHDVRQKLGIAGASSRVVDLACSLMESRYAV